VSRRVVIRGAKTGDRLGTFDEATGIVEDVQGRRRDGIADLDAALDVMRGWSWVVDPPPADNAWLDGPTCVELLYADGRREMRHNVADLLALMTETGAGSIRFRCPEHNEVTSERRSFGAVEGDPFGPGF
jgi:hypothetical protein